MLDLPFTPPSPARLERLLRSLATLDAILSPDWEGRYYAFDTRWNPESGARMGSMRDGCGDEWFALFTQRGVAVTGNAHEHPAATDLFASFPDAIEGFLDEPAFSTVHATFGLWCLEGGSWQGRIIAHAGMLDLWSGRPEDYVEWATDYYEQPVPLAPVQAVYAHEPLRDDLLAALNPDLDQAALREELPQLGYPMGERV